MDHLYLSHWNDSKIVYVKSNIAKNLKNYHLAGVRFIYNNFRKKLKGCMISYDDGMCIPVIIQAFLSSIFQSQKINCQILVLTSADNIVSWYYHLKDLQNNVEILNDYNSEQLLPKCDSTIILVNVDDLKLVHPFRENEFSFVFVDHIEEVVNKLTFKKLSGNFNVGFTPKDFLKDRDQKLMWSMLNWSNPNKFGKISEFPLTDKEHIENLRDPCADYWLNLHYNADEGFEENTEETQSYMETLREFVTYNKRLFGSNSAVKSRSKIMRRKESARNPINDNVTPSNTGNKRNKKGLNNLKRKSKRNFVQEEETNSEDEEISTVKKCGKNSKNVKCKKLKTIDSSDDNSTSIEESDKYSLSKNKSGKLKKSDSDDENTTSSEESNKWNKKKGMASMSKNAGKKRWNRVSSSDDEIIVRNEMENTKESSKGNSEGSNESKVVSDEEIFNFGFGNSKKVTSKNDDTKVNEMTNIDMHEVTSEEEVFNFRSNNIKNVNKKDEAIITENKTEEGTSDEEIFNFGTKSRKKHDESDYSINLNNHASTSSVLCQSETNYTFVNKDEDDTDLLLSIMSGDFASKSQSTSSQISTDCGVSLEMDLLKASSSNNEIQNILDDSKRGNREGMSTGKQKKCTEASKKVDVLKDLFSAVDKDLGDAKGDNNKKSGLSKECRAALVASLFADI